MEEHIWYIYRADIYRAEIFTKQHTEKILRESTALVISVTSASMESRAVAVKGKATLIGLGLAAVVLLAVALVALTITGVAPSDSVALAASVSGAAPSDSVALAALVSGAGVSWPSLGVSWPSVDSSSCQIINTLGKRVAKH